MKLLLVDDDAFLRDMYATKFGESGYTVSVAKNSTETLTLLEKGETFDIILMDMVMPGVSGVDLLKKIKQFPQLKDTKCIILSNQGEQSDIDGATKAGADGYIVKAESIPSEVVAKVEKIAS